MGGSRWPFITVWLLASASCAVPTHDPVQIAGNRADALLVLRYIRAAERNDAATFDKLTGRSVEKTFAAPLLSEVDRTDKQCRLDSLDGSIRMVSATWRCPTDTKQNVQRTFLIEGDHVTAMWNDWTEAPTVAPDVPNVR